MCLGKKQGEDNSSQILTTQTMTFITAQRIHIEAFYNNNNHM